MSAVEWLILADQSRIDMTIVPDTSRHFDRRNVLIADHCNFKSNGCIVDFGNDPASVFSVELSLCDV